MPFWVCFWTFKVSECAFSKNYNIGSGWNFRGQMLEDATSPPQLASGKQLCPQPVIFYFFSWKCAFWCILVEHEHTSLLTEGKNLTMFTLWLHKLHCTHYIQGAMSYWQNTLETLIGQWQKNATRKNFQVKQFGTKHPTGGGTGQFTLFVPM